MGYCFYKHGILPPEYRKLNDTDKLLMLSAIEFYGKKEQEATSASSGKRIGNLEK